MNRMRYIILQLVLAGFICFAHANDAAYRSYAEAGYPFIRNFSPKEYGAGPSNWCVLQDKRGVMYFGNESGILEYDGINWRFIKVSKTSFVRSLSMDDHGRIYVAALADFGYLEPDSTGMLVYKSLRHKLDQKYQHIGEVWDVLATPEGVFFKTRDYLLGLFDDRLKVWKVEGTYRIYRIGNRVYVRNHGVGLMRVTGYSLSLIPGGDRFANIGVYDMLPFPSSQLNQKQAILITTATDGLFLFDGSSVRRFGRDLDSLLLKSQLYHTALLSDSTFAIGTQRSGVIIINRGGKLLNILDKNSGLKSQIIYYVYPDREGGLWLALANGLARVEIPSSLSFYREKLGLKSNVNSVVRHQGRLFAADNYGVNYLSEAPENGQPPAFKPIEEINKPAYRFYSAGDMLLTATNNGFYFIKDNMRVTILSSIPNDGSMIVSRYDSNTVYMSTRDGIGVVRKYGDKWEFTGTLPGINYYVEGLVEEEKGVLWTIASDLGLYRIQFNTEAEPSLSQPRVEPYFAEHDFTVSSMIYLNDHVAFCTDNGLKRLDPTGQSLIADSSFGAFFADSTCLILKAVRDASNDWYIYYKQGGQYEIGRLRFQENGKIFWSTFSDLNRIDLETVTSIYPDRQPHTGDPILWVGTSEGLIRFDIQNQTVNRPDFHAIIRKITVNQDSLIYGGSASLAVSQKDRNAPVLSFKENNMNFDFSAPSYDKPVVTQYRTFLENFDETWSSWSERNRKDYTNLPPGEFRFRVEAKNVYDQISRQSAFNFEILPPWYQTWGAYIFYGLILIAGTVTADRVQRRRVIAKEQERARIREIELHAKEAEARSQAAEAKAMALQSENDRKKHVELYSEIGKEITSSLDFETIFLRLYDHLKKLADISIFEIGIYHPENHRIEYNFFIKFDKLLSPYSIDTTDKKLLAVWCIENQKPVFINDAEQECGHHPEQSKESNITSKPDESEIFSNPASLIYLPLIAHEKVLGIIGICSFKKNAYTEHHLNTLQNLAAYITIALDNADTYRKLNATIEDLKSTQEKLITQEKLASLGALTAGIAHEIKNPLNFVNNFSELSMELVDELKDIIAVHKGKFTAEEIENLEEILQHLNFNAAKVGEHGKRADNIVRSMLEHSRGKSDEIRETNINAMLEEDINLAYHGMRAQDSSFNVKIEKQFDTSIGKLPVIPQNTSRVFLNIISNGLYAVNSRKKDQPAGFEPTIRICTENHKDHVRIRIRDNGSGIPKSVQDKLFTPFFTTKPSGQGTGLGLSLSYDIIVKEHNGSITFETEEGEFTEFIISLPKSGA